MSKERSKGRFLTETQRKYMIGNHKPPNRDAEYTMQSKIRSRIQGALFEFRVINGAIADNDHAGQTIKTLFEDWSRLPEGIKEEDSPQQMKVRSHTAAIEAIIGMAYRGYRLNGMDANEFVKSIVGNAIRKAEADRQGVRPQDVSLELNLGEIEVQTDPLNKWEQDMTLTKGEYQELHDRLSEKLDREISVSEMDDLIDKHLLTSDSQSDD